MANNSEFEIARWEYEGGSVGRPGAQLEEPIPVHNPPALHLRTLRTEVPPATFTELCTGFQQRAEPRVDGKGALTVSSILLPVDFTERSVGAARYAVDLAKRFDAKVTLLHVVATHLSREDGPLTLGQRQVQHAVAELLRTVPFRCTSVLGDPARRIIEHARTERADLILMLTRGRRGWGGLLTDSVTARVMRHAHCPVWTIVEDVPGRSDIRNVLCALTLAPRSAQALKWASKFADHFEARLSIVHSSVAFTKALSACYSSNLTAARRAWAQQDIGALQRAAGTQAAVWLETDSHERGVTAVARRIPADLLVIGRSPRPWLLGRLWTRAYDIVCTASCPVVIC